MHSIYLRLEASVISYLASKSSSDLIIAAHQKIIHDRNHAGIEPMTRDPIVAQVGKVREAFAETFDFDIRAICDDLRTWQKETGHQDELPPKRKKGAGAVA